jgi:hypothetical protein
MSAIERQDGQEGREGQDVLAHPARTGPELR